jgi:lambda family phage portal protein
MKRGFISRLRAAWAVARGVNRSTRMQAGSFAGAQSNRMTLDWIAGILSADQEIRGNIRLLRARARELSRNNPIAKNYLNLLAANVVGPKGINYQAQVRNNDGNLNLSLNQKIEDAWNDWAKAGNCTADGKMSLRAVEDLVVRTVATDGEVFIRMVPGFENKYRFALQLIDADQVDYTLYNAWERNGNEIRMGVEVDKWGKPQAYWVTPQNAASFAQFGVESFSAQRVGAEYIVHLYDPARCNQTRGITWFHAVMYELRMLEGYVEAELVAARTGAAKMGWLYYTDASAFEAPQGDGNGAPPRFTLDANPGVIESLPPGMEFKEWNPDHPANAFPNFVVTLLREIATGLGVSYNALASDLTNVNYSSMRSGLLIERDNWKRLQSWLSENFLQRIFATWLPMALLSGELVLDSRDPSKFMAGAWRPRGWQWVDPLKDVQASILAVDSGLASRQSIVSERGEDFEDILEQLSEEDQLIEDYGVEIARGVAPTKISKVQPDEGDGSTTAADGSEKADAGERAVVVLKRRRK